MFKKILLSFLTAVVLFTSFFAKPVHAQTTWYDQDIIEWYLKVHDPNVSPQSDIFGERYTQAQVEWIIYSLLTWPITKFLDRDLSICLLSSLQGSVPIDTCGSAMVNIIENFISRNPASDYFARQKSDKTILSQIFEDDRPLSGISYVKQRLRKFNIVPEAKAQGFGFTSALNPFQVFWRVCRDIVYSLFVIATVIMAFMIMFRVRLSPQTVVTVQSAIPKIVIGLILVTFSYAIAGFLVDLMYVAIGIVSLIFANAGSSILAGAPSNPRSYFNLMTTGFLYTGVWGFVFFYIPLFLLVSATTFVISFGVLGSLLSAPVFLIILFFTPLLVIALLIVNVIFALKTTWMLFRTFVNIVLLTIIAPFQILIGLFQNSFGFGVWLKNYISNLLIFVTTGALFILCYVFLAMSLEVQSSLLGGSNLGARLLASLFGFPITSIVTGSVTPGWPPLIIPADTFAGFLYLGVSFVIFTTVPKTAELIKSLFAGKPFAYGSGVGEMLAPAAAAGMLGGQLASTAQQQQYQRYQAHLRGGGAPLRAPETMQALGQALRQLFPKIR